MKKATVIGSGFSSLSAACYLAKAGYNVHLYEKNEQLGGRARQYKNQGFTFDMGPTWYWMPDVFDRFFSDFGKVSTDYYTLEKLGPAYRVYFGEDEYVDISDNLEEIYTTFENIEKGAGNELRKFITKAKSNYNIAIKDLVYNPGVSPLELVTPTTAKEIKQFVTTIRGSVKSKFTHPKLRQILEFPVLFLGAKPQDTPAFYSFMNYADFGLGTWYPKGGMRSVVDGIITLATDLGVTFHTSSNVEEIQVVDGKATYVSINGEHLSQDVIVSGADYAHSESLLPKQYRAYSDSYWDNRVMAPSSLLFYVGIDKKLKNVLHHTLFFDSSFDAHAVEIYDEPSWPKDPLFYASFPSMTDDTIAPEGKEAAIFLIPLAVDLEDTEELRQKYFDIIMTRLENLTDQKIKESIIFNTSYCVNDFKDDYNSFKGNAYGMANTLFQTAFLRPKLKSKRVDNLFFTGQLTVPGPGVPPALISGKLVTDLIIKN
ncbi:MAG: phytoene desaturase [Salibacteraceae bacterium]|jgi:phytoene desaturase